MDKLKTDCNPVIRRTDVDFRTVDVPEQGSCRWSSYSRIVNSRRFFRWNYTVSPEWHVISGQWQVTSDPADAANQVLFKMGTDEGFITTGSHTGQDSVDAFLYRSGWGFPGILPRFQRQEQLLLFPNAGARKQARFQQKSKWCRYHAKIGGLRIQQNTWYTLKVVLSGTSVRGYIVENGMDRLVFDLNDTSIATGTVGIRNKWQTVHIDDVMIAEPPRVNEAVLARMLRRHLRFHCIGRRWKGQQGIVFIARTRRKATTLMLIRPHQQVMWM